MAKTLSVKVNAPELLEKQLSRRAKKEEYGITATEPYMPIEEKLKLTRKLLETILKYKFPVHVLTKSRLVTRDLDLFKDIDNEAILPEDLKQNLSHGVIISFSLSTLDERMAKLLEPGAPPPQERLETMQKCKEEGFLVGVEYIPVLPFLSDTDEQLDKMIKTAKDYKADFVLLGALTLFGNGPADCKTLYYKFLGKYIQHFYRNIEVCSEYSFSHQRNIRKSSKKKQKCCVRNTELDTGLYDKKIGRAHFLEIMLRIARLGNSPPHSD